MSIKATTIFFILLTMAACDHDESLKKLKGFVKPIIEDLTNLNLSNEEAVRSIVKNFNNVLGVEMVFSGQSLPEQLASLLSVESYIGTPAYTPAKFDNAEVALNAQKIVDAIPAYSQLSAANQDPNQVKTEILAIIRKAGLDYIGVLHKAIVYELHDQLTRKASKFEFIKYESQTKEFSSKVTDRMREYNTELNKKGMPLSEDTKAVLKEYSENYRKFYQQYYFSAKYLATFYVEPTATLRRFIQYLAYEQAVNAQTDQPINLAAAERIGLMAQALSRLTGQSSDNNIIVAYEAILGFLSNNDENAAIFGHKDFQKFIYQSARNMLLAMLPIFPVSEVKQRATDLLVMNTELIETTPDTLSILESSYQTNDFQSASAGDSLSATEQQLRNFDIIVNMPEDVISEERFHTLIGNVDAIASSDPRRRILLTRLKTLIGTPLINFQLNLQLFAKIYDTSVHCVAWVPEDKLGNDPHELLDECIEHLAANGDNEFIKKNYVTVKFLNLFFMSDATDYQTSFRQIQVGDMSLVLFLDLIKKNTWLYNVMEHHFRLFMGDDYPATHVSSDVVTYYSGKTMQAKLFAAVNKSTSYEEIVHQSAQANNNKIEIALVKDKKQPGQSGPQSDPQNDEQRNKAEAETNPALIGQSPKVIIDSHPAGSSPKKENQLPQGAENNDLPLLPGGNKKENQLPQVLDNNDLPLIIPSDNSEPKTRIQIGERQNLVNEIIGRIPKEDLEALKNGSVDDFIKKHDLVVTKDGVETTFVFVKVTRRQSPCHPGNGKRC